MSTDDSALGLPSHVALLGLGAMGGSLARALKAEAGAPWILGVSPDPDERAAALEAGAVDEAAPVPSDPALGPVGLVVLALPLGVTVELLGPAAAAAPSAVLTDVASLKGPVMDRVGQLGLGERFVGSHPMAGTTGSGFGASRSDLYRDRDVWLTGAGAGPRAQAVTEALWRAVGARPAWTDAGAHDRRMVWASHLPQMSANALAAVLAEAGLDRGDLGPGGLDMTRLAGSSPEMWADLLRSSAPELAPALRRLSAALEGLAGRLDAADGAALDDLMRRTRAWTEGEGWT